jgi:hypothetical protein
MQAKQVFSAYDWNENKRSKEFKYCPFCGTRLYLQTLQWFPLFGPLPEMAFEADAHIIERYGRTRLKGAPVDPDFASAKR